MSAAEVAQGTRYTQSLKTSWRAPRHYRDMTEEECDKLRDKWSILVDVSGLDRCFGSAGVGAGPGASVAAVVVAAAVVTYGVGAAVAVVFVVVEVGPGFYCYCCCRCYC